METPKLLWIDCLGGLFVGAIVILGYRFIANWHNLPASLIIFLGVANLLYGCYSLSIATRKTRPMAMIQLLAIANFLWLPVCVAMVAATWNQISWIGITQILGEGIYVASLGVIEWWRRNQLATF